METPLPRVLRSRRRSVLKVLGTALALAAVPALIFYPTLRGLLFLRLPWREDAFVGKPLSELQKAVAADGRSLTPLDAASFYSLTDKTLGRNQRALSFIKGREYSWFRVGKAVNVGYVVVDSSGGDRVTEILHGRSVDSP